MNALMTLIILDAKQNLTMWVYMRRFTRLTNGFSKKIERRRAPDGALARMSQTTVYDIR